jgi:hypothetical protein
MQETYYNVNNVYQIEQNVRISPDVLLCSGERKLSVRKLALAEDDSSAGRVFNI